MSWKGYSSDFEDAYERRYKKYLGNSKYFEDMVYRFENFRKKKRILSDRQIKALAYEANRDGIEPSIKVLIRDKRTKSGFRKVYRNLINGRWAKNPNK